MHAGFAEIDITPPLGTQKIGWIKKIVGDTVRDPLYARVAVFKDGVSTIAFVQLDTLSVRWTYTQELRQKIEQAHGIPAGQIMVSASHNHAGPAIAGLGEVSREEAYLADLAEKCVQCVGLALANAQEAELGYDRVFNFDIAHNRRTLMRDGTVKSHGSFLQWKDALCTEGPVDPEVAVLAARSVADGTLLGCMVNYACHPTHHGGDTSFSAGYPGVLAREMNAHKCPVTLFLNGACGNTHHSNQQTGENPSMEECGIRLAEDARRAISSIDWSSEWPLASGQVTLSLPFREATEEQIKGTAFGAQRFVDPNLYDQFMYEVLERIETHKQQKAEVQVLALGDVAFASIPAEYFVEYGLQIKQVCFPRKALVVSCANGMIGYVPTREAFAHGGYETTFFDSSRLAPECGEILADAAIALIQETVSV